MARLGDGLKNSEAVTGIIQNCFTPSMYQDVKKLSKISQFQMLVQSIITVNIITAIKKQLN